MKTIRAWCQANAIECRPEYGRRMPDGTHHVIQYWIAKNDALEVIAAIRDVRESVETRNMGKVGKGRA